MTFINTTELENITLTKKVKEWLAEKGYLDNYEITKSTYKLAEEFIQDSKENYSKSLERTVSETIRRILIKEGYKSIGTKWMKLEKLFEGTYEISDNKVEIYNKPLLRFILKEYAPESSIWFIKRLIDHYTEYYSNNFDKESIEKLTTLDLGNSNNVAATVELSAHLIVNIIDYLIYLLNRDNKKINKVILDNVLKHIKKKIAEKAKRYRENDILKDLRKYYLLLLLLIKLLKLVNNELLYENYYKKVEKELQNIIRKLFDCILGSIKSIHGLNKNDIISIIIAIFELLANEKENLSQVYNNIYNLIAPIKRELKRNINTFRDNPEIFRELERLESTVSDMVAQHVRKQSKDE